MKRFLSGLLMAYLYFSPVFVIANTPDGRTPANEGVCNVLLDHTPGLYGLCVAYCEAQSLDEVIDAENLDAQQLAQVMSNGKILDAYNRKKGAGDPDMPCVQKPCPCWNFDQIAASNWTGNGGICANAVPTSGIGSTFFLSEGPHLAGVVLQFAPDPQVPPFDVCFYRDPAASTPISIQMPVPADQYQVCRSQIEQTCAELGYPVP